SNRKADICIFQRSSYIHHQTAHDCAQKIQETIRCSDISLIDHLSQHRHKIHIIKTPSKTKYCHGYDRQEKHLSRCHNKQELRTNPKTYNQDIQASLEFFLLPAIGGYTS